MSYRRDIHGNEQGSAESDRRKQSLYMPEPMLQELKREARRQDRSLSWLMQQAWKHSRAKILAFPGVEDAS
jgi:uncharacterized small protein (TIGR04563 family)